MGSRTTDGSDNTNLVASGSLGVSYVSMSFESTASLGLSESISIVSESVAHVLNDTTSSYDYAHMERAVKFISAKMYNNRDVIAEVYTGDQVVTGNRSFNSVITGSISGSVTGNASTATLLETARTIGGTKFDGSANITPANATLAAKATILETARTIGGVSFNGSSNIVPTGHKGSITNYPFTGLDFFVTSISGLAKLRPNVLVSPTSVVGASDNSFVANFTLPLGLSPGDLVVYGSNSKATYKVWASILPTSKTGALKFKYYQVDGSKNGISWNSTTKGVDILKNMKANSGVEWSSSEYSLTITVDFTEDSDVLYGGNIQLTL